MTWQNKVDRFIALTQFARQKFIEAGFPGEKIIVKPNFCEVPGVRDQTPGMKHGALFVGRLGREKGIATLLAAWKMLNVPLRIAGDGPLAYLGTEHRSPSIIFLGRLTSEQVYHEMSQAAFLVMPSEWYETFGLVIIEAYAHGTPVVVSKLGAMAEIIEDGVTGLHFEPGNPHHLAEKVQWMHDHPEECRQMGQNARQVYEEKYTPEKNYEMLMDVYHQAIEARKVDK
ncbi:hypothetical protein DGMP_07530 [Desulfomarina profundi]|uniref:Glycosyl transferase family 1 domain-containing protein n=2 Tax=Desulfomarina profundi TaxID=2772557 RepID=A0A8D5FLV9_9BACT|nr:hypothetical protein DGMP_07530 [Desulfomarina profundi]